MKKVDFLPAKWIWTNDNTTPDQRVIVRKQFNIFAKPSRAVAYISCETKFWMWLNGKEIVFEGGVFRESIPGCGYAEKIDLAGIRQDDDVAGYETVVVAHILVSKLNRINAKRTLPGGEITVSYQKNGENVDFIINVPKGQKAVFRFGGKETELYDGENKFSEKI